MSGDDESENRGSDDADTSSIVLDYSGSENDDSSKEESNLSNDLAYYAVKSGTPQEYVNLLLKILHENNVKNIPKSYSTLVGTPKKKIEQQPM